MAVAGQPIKRRYVIALLVLTSLTLITLDARRDDSGPLGVVGTGVHEVVAPLRSAGEAVVGPVSDWLDGITSAGSLREENEELRRELAQARATIQRAEGVIEENRLLAELLGVEYLEGIDTIAARVVSPSVGNFEETITIGKGTSDGVRKDMPVVADGGLYGRVLEASPSEAKVMLLTDERFSVSVRSARDRLVGIAAGDGSDTLVLDFISAVDDGDEEAEPVVVRGDSVVTSGLDGSRYPPGIPVGRISAVVEDEAAGSRTAEVEPAVDVGAIELVQVLDWDPVRDAAEPEPDE